MTMTISKMVIKHWLQPEDYNQNVTLWQSGVNIPNWEGPRRGAMGLSCKSIELVYLSQACTHQMPMYMLQLIFYFT